MNVTRAMVRAMELNVKIDLRTDERARDLERVALQHGACFMPSSKLLAELRSAMASKARELGFKRPRLLDWALRLNPTGATVVAGVAFCVGRNAEGFDVRFDASVALY